MLGHGLPVRDRASREISCVGLHPLVPRVREDDRKYGTGAVRATQFLPLRHGDDEGKAVMATSIVFNPGNTERLKEEIAFFDLAHSSSVADITFTASAKYPRKGPGKLDFHFAHDFCPPNQKIFRLACPNNFAAVTLIASLEHVV